jgi:hypothetical protein
MNGGGGGVPTGSLVLNVGSSAEKSTHAILVMRDDADRR